jgi:hypothetical protein
MRGGRTLGSSAAGRPLYTDTIEERGTAARTGAGWHTCLDTLAYALAGQAPPWTGEQRWRQVHPSYVSQYGPEAATIGPPAGHPVLDTES